MPSTINGIGTTYIGKKNLKTVAGICEFCKRESNLSEYETGLYFSVLFIPIIPLGRKQVLDYCPICTQHRAIPLNEFHELRDQAIDSATTELSEQMDDPKSAVKLHATYLAFHQNDEAKSLAQGMKNSFADDIDVQLYLGGWFESIGEEKITDECFARAAEIDAKHPGVLRARAVDNMRAGNLDLAREQLKDFEPPAEIFDPALFFMLASGYQEQNRHQEANEIHTMLLEAIPELGRDKEFRKTVRESEQLLGKTTSIVKSDPFYTSKFFWIPAIAALLLIGVFGFNFYVSQNRTLHIVNGLPVEIQLQIDDGSSLVVPPTNRIEVPIAEGSYTAKLSAPAELANIQQPINFNIRANWMDRFFKKPVFLLDPARCSVVSQNRIIYSVQRVPPEIKVFAGEAFSYQPHVDYQFIQPPAQITTKSKKPVEKRHVALEFSHPSVLMGQPKPFESEEHLQFMQRWLRVTPEDEMLLGILTTQRVARNETEQLDEFMKFGLEKRPLLIGWHRVYQNLAERKQPIKELQGVYQKLLDADPDDSGLIYLNARIEPDFDKAIKLYEKAIEKDPQNGFAHGGLAYHRASTGKFKKALAGYKTAIECNTKTATAQFGLLDMYFANELFKKVVEFYTDEPQNLFSFRNQYEATSRAKLERAKSMLENYRAFLRQYQPLDAIEEGMSAEYSARYIDGDIDGLKKLIRQNPNSIEGSENMIWKFFMQIEDQKLREALKTVENFPDSRRIFLYLCAMVKLGTMKSANQQLQKETLEKVGTEWGAQGHDEKVARDLLNKDSLSDEDLQRALRSSINKDEKIVFLIALAQKNPSRKEKLLELAKKLNYRRTFPYLLAK